MKKIKLVLAAFIITLSTSINAQTADEIVSNYLEAIGGTEKLMAITGTKMVGDINAQGMKIPLEVVAMKDGRMYVQIEFQGQKVKQLFSDGEKIYVMNMMSQSVEEMPSEESKMMMDEFKDFPNAFVDYKEKGYAIELVGKETAEGTECFKIKLTKKPFTIKGEEVPNVTFYYFDAESFVPIMTEQEVPSGPQKGQVMKTPLSDYAEVDGVYFPFTTSMQGMPMTYTEIVINPEVTDADFAKPAEEKKETETKN